MRLWSLHPSLLDTKGLVACWREAKLALAVLENKTKGYKHHPQLDRFKSTPNPVHALKVYLRCLYDESVARGYNFDSTCIADTVDVQLPVTTGQLEFEYQHLQKKVAARSPNHILKDLTTHPMFDTIDGSIETWERL